MRDEVYAVGERVLIDEAGDRVAAEIESIGRSGRITARTDEGELLFVPASMVVAKIPKVNIQITPDHRRLS